MQRSSAGGDPSHPAKCPAPHYYTVRHFDGVCAGGSVATEQAFGVPGLGRTLVTAVIERDIIVVQNLVFLYGNIFILINVMVDLSYA